MVVLLYIVFSEESRNTVRRNGNHWKEQQWTHPKGHQRTNQHQKHSIEQQTQNKFTPDNPKRHQTKNKLILLKKILRTTNKD